MITVAGFVLAAAAGATLRHLTRVVVARYGTVPVGTLAVNLLGSFLLGLVVGWDPPGATVIGTAGLGALTTFSTFSEEVVELRARGWHWSVGYLVVTLAGGVSLAWTGIRLG